MSDFDNRANNGEPIIAGRGPGLTAHVPGAAGRCGAARAGGRAVSRFVVRQVVAVQQCPLVRLGESRRRVSL